MLNYLIKIYSMRVAVALLIIARYVFIIYLYNSIIYLYNCDVCVDDAICLSFRFSECRSPMRLPGEKEVHIRPVGCINSRPSVHMVRTCVLWLYANVYIFIVTQELSTDPGNLWMLFVEKYFTKHMRVICRYKVTLLLEPFYNIRFSVIVRFIHNNCR